MNNNIVGTPTLSTTNLDENATITVSTTGNVGNAVINLSDDTGMKIAYNIDNGYNFTDDTYRLGYYPRSRGRSWSDD